MVMVTVTMVGMKTVCDGDDDGGGGHDEGGDGGTVMPSVREWPSPEVCRAGVGGASSAYTLHTIFRDILWLSP